MRGVSWSVLECLGENWRIMGSDGGEGCNALPRLHPMYRQNIRWVENLPINSNRKIKTNPWIPTKWQSQVESVRIPPIPMAYPLRVPHDLPESVEVTGHNGRGSAAA